MGRTGACKNGIGGARHRPCQGYLRKSNIREGRDNALRDIVCSEEERVDCCNPNQGACHTCRGNRHSASGYRASDPYPYTKRTPLHSALFVAECPWALSSGHLPYLIVRIAAQLRSTYEHSSCGLMCHYVLFEIRAGTPYRDTYEEKFEHAS